MILTPQGWLQDGILSFDAEGRLLRIERTDRIDAQQNVEFYNGALVPGFVNAHCHLELSYLKGRIARGGGLAAFADAIASERGKTSPEERAAAAAYWDCRMFRDGVTAVGLAEADGDVLHAPATADELALTDPATDTP